MFNLNMSNQLMSTSSSPKICGTHQLIMQLQLVLFVLLYTTTLLHYSYGSSSLANNTNQHFAGNNNSRFVTLDQLNAAVVMDLQGSINEGSYRVTLKLGQHAQEYSFMIDTGSDLTWVNCQTTSTISYPHQAYNPPEHSKVFCNDPICPLVEHPTRFPCNHATDECYYKISYVDKTYTWGNVIVDSLALPFTNIDHSLLHASIKIGCGSHQKHARSSAIRKRVMYDGVLGLAKDSKATIIRQLAKNGIMRAVFGHCISRPNNGYFFIGVGQGQDLPSRITWTRMVTLPRNKDDYSPGRASLLFDDQLTTVRNLKTVFDSGSTISYFKTTVLRAIIKLVKDNLVKVGAPLRQIQREGFPICWAGPHRSIDEVAVYFKTMTLIFPTANNVRFELPPYTYLTVEPRDDNSDVGDVCFGIDDGARHGLGEVNLIGDIFFQNKLVIYDLDREMIGWAPSNCNNRRMNDRKRRHRNDRMYRHRDLSRHRVSTIPMWHQPPPTNYTSIKL